jgi:3-oxoacyl-[acyl-carrier protein] reductase
MADRAFDGRTAIVAGAGGGIGLEIANRLVTAGATVHLADLKPEPGDVVGGPGRAVYHRGDLTDPVFVALVAEAAGERVDCLVNTAAVLWFERDRSFADIDLDLWDRIFATNLKSYVLTARSVVPRMRVHGGAMVHFSSIDALRGDPAPQDAYAISKAAVIRFSRSVAVQFAGDGIRSNAILPGPVHTPMQQRWIDDPTLERTTADRIPLGRVGTPADLADACLFLLSEQASWITGTELIVDGGVSA